MYSPLLLRQTLTYHFQVVVAGCIVMHKAISNQSDSRIAYTLNWILRLALAQHNTARRHPEFLQLYPP